MRRVVVYTDLDGTLLDHDTYSWQAAAAQLDVLHAAGIPVVPCTSKTRSEVLQLRDELGSTDPFIVENGAAVFIPKAWGAAGLTALVSQDDSSFLRREFVAGRAHWLALLEAAFAAGGRVARGFSEMSSEEIAALTKLPQAQAVLAATREYGEPLTWLAPPEQRSAFLDYLSRHDAVILHGGRFSHLLGRTDKGRALQWLQCYFAAKWGERPISIAAGDSQNDAAMLEAADWALLVRSPSHRPPFVNRSHRLRVSDDDGPAGWAQGIAEILAEIERGGYLG